MTSDLKSTIDIKLQSASYRILQAITPRKQSLYVMYVSAALALASIADPSIPLPAPFIESIKVRRKSNMDGSLQHHWLLEMGFPQLPTNFLIPAYNHAVYLHITGCRSPATSFQYSVKQL